MGVTSDSWQPRYKWKPVNLTTYRKCFLLSRQEAAGSKVHRFNAANKVRKNWPWINKNCPSSLFSFIIQAMADPNHPIPFHPHLGLLPALLNIQRHFPLWKGHKLFSTINPSTAPLCEQPVKRDYKTQLWVWQVSQTWGLTAGDNQAGFSVPTTHSSGHGELLL